MKETKQVVVKGMDTVRPLRTFVMRAVAYGAQSGVMDGGSGGGVVDGVAICRG